MKKLINILMSIMLAVLMCDYIINIDNRTLPERVIETVVMVNGSSGIVVYSDNRQALVLTAYHNVSDDIEEGCIEGEECAYKSKIFVVYEMYVRGRLLQIAVKLDVENIVYDEKNDLALIDTKIKYKLNVAKIATRKTRLGEEIYVASNPQDIFRSIKKGIVSGLLRIVDGTPTIEIDAGIIFGSSGGGVFNDRGEIIGIVKAVAMLVTDQCYDEWDNNGNFTGQHCIHLPVPFLGFAVRQDTIHKFLLQSEYANYFKYLQ